MNLRTMSIEFQWWKLLLYQIPNSTFQCLHCSTLQERKWKSLFLEACHIRDTWSLKSMTCFSYKRYGYVTITLVAYNNRKKSESLNQELIQGTAIVETESFDTCLNDFCSITSEWNTKRTLSLSKSVTEQRWRITYATYTEKIKNRTYIFFMSYLFVKTR